MLEMDNVVDRMKDDAFITLVKTATEYVRRHEKDSPRAGSQICSSFRGAATR